MLFNLVSTVLRLVAKNVKILMSKLEFETYIYQSTHFIQNNSKCNNSFNSKRLQLVKRHQEQGLTDRDLVYTQNCTEFPAQCNTCQDNNRFVRIRVRCKTSGIWCTQLFKNYPTVKEITFYAASQWKLRGGKCKIV